MAGMFYSLEEVVEKLNKNEDQIKELVKQGRLREFRDGSNLLFKVNEVEALMSDTAFLSSPEEPLEPTGEIEMPDEPLEDAAPESEEVAEEMGTVDELPEETAAELAEGTGAEEDLEDSLDETTIEPAEASLEQETPIEAAEVDEVTDEPLEETAIEPAAEFNLAEDEILLAPEAESAAGPESTDELLLGSGSGLGEGTASTDETTVAGEGGINVLGETDGGYKLADDTLGETRSGSDAEASLEEIEEDVNLDTFGSGSGLLDLSLQADDTSLGGILDEIYTPEGEAESEEGAAAGSFQSGELEAGSGAASAVELSQESPFAGPEPVVAAPALIQAEAEPDSSSNILGMMLFLPLLAVIYASIVAIAGSMGVMPSILSSLQGIIWPILIGGIVVALIMTAVAFMGGGGAVKAKKPKIKAKKAKSKKIKPKKEKPKKEKKKKEKKK